MASVGFTDWSRRRCGDFASRDDRLAKTDVHPTLFGQLGSTGLLVGHSNGETIVTVRMLRRGIQVTAPLK